MTANTITYTRFTAYYGITYGCTQANYIITLHLYEFLNYLRCESMSKWCPLKLEASGAIKLNTKERNTAKKCNSSKQSDTNVYR